MRGRCLVCASTATESDGLCRRCAGVGSEQAGLWTAGVWLEGHPATTLDAVRAVLHALNWASCEFAEDEPGSGIWLLELPPCVRGLLLSHGHVCHRVGNSWVEVELP